MTRERPIDLILDIVVTTGRGNKVLGGQVHMVVDEQIFSIDILFDSQTCLYLFQRDAILAGIEETIFLINSLGD